MLLGLSIDYRAQKHRHCKICLNNYKVDAARSYLIWQVLAGQY